MTLGIAAQLAAARCLNELTLDPQYQLDRPTYAPSSCTIPPRNVLRQQLTIFSSEYYQVLVATHLLTPEEWKAELA